MSAGPYAHMSSTAAADIVHSLLETQTKAAMTEPDNMESNHDLPARTATEDEKLENSHPHVDDPATMAASEELKHTTISDKIASHSRVEIPEKEPESVEEEADKDMGGTAKPSTPEPDVTEEQDEEMKERLSSPKKKRGRDADEDASQLDEENTGGAGSSADGSVENGGRTTASGPEKKKRARDTSEEFTRPIDEIVDSKLDTPTTDATNKPSSESQSQEAKLPKEKATEEIPQTSSSAFANSGFASLAGSSTSGFGSLGASKPSVFGGGKQMTTSGFGALASAKPPSTAATTAASGFGAISTNKPSTGFGFGSTTISSFGSGTSSGFGGLATGSVFGSKLTNGFGGGAGPKLSSFAAPGTENKIIGTKPAKAFGAPESEEEDGSDDDDSDNGAEEEEEESTAVTSEEKKKGKLSKVHIDDGEAGEATLLQLRAKLFAIESKETGWKERGVGTLKVNVPRSCAAFDESTGLAIPGSFDLSGLEDEDLEPGAPRAPRLIMRQENTHRVILNTTIMPGMEFQDKPSASTAQILFTAFEGEKELKGISMLLKLSEANAKLFRAEMDSIKREL